MTCPTCDHTMQAIGCRVTDKNFYWCPRCGTIKPCEEKEAVAPALVERCRRFERFMLARKKYERIQADDVEWRILGIAESIRKPEDRPT